MSTTVIQPKSSITLRRIFEGLEGVIIIIAGYLTLFLKTVRSQWGMQEEEKNRKYPLDEIIPNPSSGFSHGINIDAPAEYVWPWIAQMGAGRGGFYSYELLEHIAGLKIYNSDEILPQFQNPKVGDEIPFGAGLGYPLILSDPGKAMAIEVAMDADTNNSYDVTAEPPQNFLHITWLWYIERVHDTHSRFISRNRVDTNRSFKNRLVFGWLAEPIIFAMDRKMCLGIKRRAERSYLKSKTPKHSS